MIGQTSSYGRRCVARHVISEDLNNACNLVADRTGLVPEVESATELVGALLEWGDSLALENKQLTEEIESLKSARDLAIGPSRDSVTA